METYTVGLEVHEWAIIFAEAAVCTIASLSPSPLET